MGLWGSGSDIPDYVYFAATIVNALLAMYGMRRVFMKFKASICYIMLGIAFSLSMVMPFGYFIRVLYSTSLLVLVWMSSYTFLVTFSFRRPNAHLRVIELFIMSWIVYLIATVFNAPEFAIVHVILSLLLAIYGVFTIVYSLGSIKSEFTAETNRSRTIPPYLCCFSQKNSQIVVPESLVDDKDIIKATAIASTAHFLLIAIYVLQGASIAMIAAPGWYYVFQFSTIPLWSCIIHVSLNIYEMGNKSPRFSFFGWK